MSVEKGKKPNKQFEDYKKMSRFENETNPHNILLNNRPNQDFLGLTPSEMHDIIYDPYGEDSGFNIKRVDDSVLDQIPFFLLTENLLFMIYRDRFAKLTPKGCLSIQYCKELLEKRIIKEDTFENPIRKREREGYFASIKAARIVLLIGGIVLEKNNKLYPTKYALQLLEEKNRLELFHVIFETYTKDFLWAYLDGYKSELIGQLGFVFSLSMLKYYGSINRSIKFYSDKYKRAFPLLEDHLIDFKYFPKEKQFISCYRYRLFKGFFEWFGLSEMEGKEDLFDPEKNLFRKTNIIDKLFTLPELITDFP